MKYLQVCPSPYPFLFILQDDGFNMVG
jgi:cytochrome P450